MSRLALFLRFLHSAVGRSTQDMLRSLRWDEQSLFNLMFVRMSIISFSMKTWGVVQGIAAAESCREHRHKRIIELWRENAFEWNSELFIEHLPMHWSHFESQEILEKHLQHSMPLLTQLGFYCTVWLRVGNGFSIIHRLPRIGTWHLRYESRLDENVFFLQASKAGKMLAWKMEDESRRVELNEMLASIIRWVNQRGTNESEIKLTNLRRNVSKLWVNIIREG